MEGGIRDYFWGQREDITHYVERFYLDLDQAKDRYTRLAQLHPDTQYKCNDELGNTEVVTPRIDRRLTEDVKTDSFRIFLE